MKKANIVWAVLVGLLLVQGVGRAAETVERQAESLRTKGFGQKPGLGVSLKTVKDAYTVKKNGVDIGMTFEDSPLPDGTPRSFGTSQDGNEIIILQGNPKDLPSITCGVMLPVDDPKAWAGSLRQLSLFIQVVAPDSEAWLRQQIDLIPAGDEDAKARVKSHGRWLGFDTKKNKHMITLVVIAD